ncbi:unnamed protein product [Haemonchus placei]|uniref:ANK_REP_REGION domain-containing protein n=1 Tax=Haemonchus placei TaxID=6290 RepID=A0A158QLG1_HAEPC|nr:unnamed protein product [Haemonchus placei]
MNAVADDKPAAKCTRKPKDVKETTDTGVSSRGPNSKQLAWLRACRKGDLVECKKLLEENPDLLHYVPPHHLNYSAVHIATLGRHYELLRFLKSKKANFNATTRIGYTPLHLAAQNQDQETARLLIREFGVDSRIHDLLGYTYEHYADWLDYPEYDETTSRFSYRECKSDSKSRSFGASLLAPYKGTLIGDLGPGGGRKSSINVGILYHWDLVSARGWLTYELLASFLD